jgi:hypothetical protein
VLNMDSNHSKLYCTCVFHAICLFCCSRMHQLGVLKTTVQLVFEYKVGKYVFGQQNTPSTHIVLNMDSNHSKLYCTFVFHAICLFFCSRMHQLGMLKTTVQSICLVSCSRMHELGVLKTTVKSVFEYKVGQYVILILGGVEYVR